MTALPNHRTSVPPIWNITSVWAELADRIGIAEGDSTSGAALISLNMLGEARTQTDTSNPILVVAEPKPSSQTFTLSVSRQSAAMEYDRNGDCVVTGR
jgi:hypothetical protein